MCEGPTERAAAAGQSLVTQDGRRLLGLYVGSSVCCMLLCARAGVSYVSPCYLECAKVELDYPGECNTTKPGAPLAKRE